jgi:hypothetical protein
MRKQIMISAESERQFDGQRDARLMTTTNVLETRPQRLLDAYSDPRALPQAAQ